MSYMIEGGGSKTLAKAKKWLYTHPEASNQLLQLITDINIDYLVNQVKAGAQMLQVFESHAEHLGPDMFKKFCVPYLVQICDKVKAKLRAENYEPVPMVFVAQQNTFFLSLELFNACRLSLPKEVVTMPSRLFLRPTTTSSDWIGQ